jgi:hypothetical protein
MATLHIEHAVSDFDTWKAAFDSFAEARITAGVRRQRIQRPVDDRNFIVLELDFDTAAAAGRFLHFLETSVWTTRESSPALVGTPQTRILEYLEI